MRSLLRLFAPALLIFALISTPGSAGATPAAADAPESELELARTKAQKAGELVEIKSMRTEKTSDFVNPDGLMVREVNAAPVRVMTSDGWSEIDTTLVKREGWLEPIASPGAVRVSRGGDASSLFSFTDEGVAVKVGWAGTLPQPSVRENAATYADVMPGVDLRVTVEPTTISHVLIVHTREAASNPALRKLSFPIDVGGGNIRKDSAGGLEITDANGEVVVGSPEPIMWDSSGEVETSVDSTTSRSTSGGADATDARSAGPANGDAITSLDTAINSAGMVITPPTDALIGSDVQYPIFIDPTFTLDPKAWTMVYKQYPTTEFYGWSGSDGEGVGFQNERGTSTKRLFWNFKSSAWAGATIFSAEFRAKLVYSWSCTATNVQAWRTKPINAKTNWNNQPTFDEGNWQESIAKAGGRVGTACEDKPWLEFNVTKGMRAVAAEREAYATFALKAPNGYESGDPKGWKRFANNARLTVTYSFPPHAPSGLGMTSPAKACGSTFGADAPYLVATLSDRDGEKLSAHYEFKGTGITGTQTFATTAKSPATQYSTPKEVPLARNATGDAVNGSYSWRVRAKDSQGLYGPWSPYCIFTIDATRPNPPSITPPVDHEWTHGGPPGTFTLGPNGSSDVTKYGWSVGSDQPTSTVPAGAGLGATISVASKKVGLNILRVWSYDRAGNLSSDFATYTFEAAGVTRTEQYLLNEGEGLAAFNTWGTTGAGMLVGAGARWLYRGSYTDPTSTSDPPATIADWALSFDGNASSVAMSFGEAPLDLRDSFTFAGWVNVADVSRRAVAVSRKTLTKAGEIPAFTLGVDVNCPFENPDGTSGTLPACYSAGVATGSQGTSIARSMSDGPATVEDGWVHLTATYVNATKELRLWVDGQRQGTAAGVTPPAYTSGASTIAIGGGWGPSLSQFTDRWVGSIDDISALQGVPDDSQVHQLFSEKAYVIHD